LHTSDPVAHVDVTPADMKGGQQAEVEACKKKAKYFPWRACFPVQP
jgi:hypothetical protein